MKIKEDIKTLFNPISLDEIDAVKMLNRNDLKFVFHHAQLLSILAEISGDYKILTINNFNIFSYQNLYYDTGSLDFYFDHHNGKRSRFKVRSRKYLETGESWLEIKEKNNKEKTIKSRKRISDIVEKLDDDSLRFIGTCLKGIDPPSLTPLLWTNFSRFTLVNLMNRERVTIDTDLTFRGYGQEASFPQLVILEIKKDRFSTAGTLINTLKEHRIYSNNLSKYCTGTAVLNPFIKRNRFKEKILTINKLRNGAASYNIAI